MNYKRRDFIKAGSNLAAGMLIIPGISCNTNKTSQSTTDGSAPATTEKPIEQFGLQLYTLREDFPKDPKGVLRQVASYGYKQIESFEGPKGMFWGMSNKEFKSYLDELGMTIVASHCNWMKDLDKKAAEASEIGMKYLIAPWIGPQKTVDDYKKRAEEFNKAGEVCRSAGVKFAYHNHDYSFVLTEGQYGQDVLMTNTDPSLVEYEMDIYWVVTAGQDPTIWLKKYPNRFTLSHVKDREKNAEMTNKNASVVVGTGSIDWPTVLKEAKKQGMEYFIVEQEKYEGTTPLKAVEADAAYMKSLKI